MCFWNIEAVRADTKLRVAKGTGLPTPEVQAAVDTLVRVGTGRDDLQDKLLLYKFTPSEADGYLDAAYPP